MKKGKQGKIDKEDIVLAIIVLIEMAWALAVLYRPTMAAEPSTGITITKTEAPAVKEAEPEPTITEEKTINISLRVEEAIKPERTLEKGDKELIARLVNAEAKGEDMIGKRLIVDVILNRQESESFPDEISSVIYEAGQFTRPSAEYTDEDMLAVEYELLTRLDRNVFYFRTGRFHGCGKKLYQHGGHYFSGKDKE